MNKRNLNFGAVFAVTIVPRICKIVMNLNFRAVFLDDTMTLYDLQKDKEFEFSRGIWTPVEFTCSRFSSKPINYTFP